MKGFLRLKKSTLFKRKKKKKSISKFKTKPSPPPAADHLTALPLDLRRLILSLLPLKDAVRTAALSSDWRRPGLPFVDRLLLVLDPSPSDVPAAIHALSLLSSSNPTTLLRRLEIPKFASFNSRSRRFLLRGAANRGLQELALHNSTVSHPYPWVPRVVLRCKSLKFLSISHCSMGPSYLRCHLPLLTTLKLHHVRVYDHLFSHIIDSCPALERLETVYCELLQIQSIHAQKLKHLLIRTSKRLKKIKVVAPNLSTLTLYTRPMLEELEIYAPKVKKAFLHLAYPSQDWGVKLEDFVVGATELERLTLRGFSVKFLVRQESFPVPLRMLRAMSLSLDLQIETDILIFLNLLESCPNLRELNLSLLSAEKMPKDDQRIEQYADRLRWLPCLVDHLEQVELSGFRVRKIERKLLRILLREGKVLKRIVLKIPECCSGKKVEAVKKLMSSQDGSVRERMPFRKFRRIQLDLPRSKLRY